MPLLQESKGSEKVEERWGTEHCLCAISQRSRSGVDLIFNFLTSPCCHKIVYHSGHPGYTRSQRSTVGSPGDRHSSIPPLVTKPSNKTSFPTSEPWPLKDMAPVLGNLICDISTPFPLGHKKVLQELTLCPGSKSHLDARWLCFVLVGLGCFGLSQMGPPPPPITVTGGGGAGWELPVPGLGLWHCPGPVWGGWVLAALLPGGCWGSPAWGQRPPRDRDASGRRPASVPGRASRGDWSGPAWPDRKAQVRASAGRRPRSGGRGAVGGGPNPFLTLRVSSRVRVPRAAPRAGPGRARGWG